MDGHNMFHFMSVMSGLLFSRGEKSAELIFIEEALRRDLSTLKTEHLRDLIDQEVKKSMKV